MFGAYSSLTACAIATRHVRSGASAAAVTAEAAGAEAEVALVEEEVDCGCLGANEIVYSSSKQSAIDGLLANCCKQRERRK